MLVPAIAWILAASGAVTAVGGLAALLFPKQLLQFVFGVKTPEGSLRFFVVHWGMLIFLVGALIAYSAQSATIRTPVLIAAIIEKVLIVALVLFGPLKRTAPMTVMAASDGAFAVLYVAYFAGL